MRMKTLVALLILPVAAIAEPAADTPEARLAAAGYALPEPRQPVATYVTSVQTGNLLFLSGHGECGKEFTTGKVGGELTVEQGVRSAEQVGLCMLATIKAADGLFLDDSHEHVESFRCELPVKPKLMADFLEFPRVDFAVGLSDDAH